MTTGYTLTDRGIEPRFPAEMWWCIECGEPSLEDPCQFCGQPIHRYRVVPAENHQGEPPTHGKDRR